MWGSSMVSWSMCIVVNGFVTQFRVGTHIFDDQRDQLLVSGRLGLYGRIAGIVEAQTKLVARRTTARGGWKHHTPQVFQHIGDALGTQLNWLWVRFLFSPVRYIACRQR